MFANRISQYPLGAASVPMTAGFAVCQLPGAPAASLPLQLIAQQQAYEAALVRAREQALAMALSRLTVSPN